MSYISQATRDKLPSDDFGGPNETFPIRNAKDVEDASRLVGHAADPEAVKRRIIEIAKRKGLTGSLPASWKVDQPRKSMFDADDTLVFFGGAVKALGAGKVAGPIIQFGSPEDADRQGDFFTEGTDYGFDISTKARIVYHHGMGKYGAKKFGVADMKMDADRVFGVGQLDMSDADGKAVYADVESGKLGWSSGSVERLVRRRDVKGASEILAWPLIEVSLTPTPVDKRNKAVAIKALMDGYGYSGPEAAISAIDTLHYAMKNDLRGHLGKSRRAREDVLSDCKAVINKHAYKCMKAVTALTGDEADEGENGDGDAMKSFLDGLAAGPSFDERSTSLVADAEELTGLFVKLADQRAKDNRSLSPNKLQAVKSIVDVLSGLLVAGGPKEDAAAKRRRLLMLRARA